MSPLIFSFYYCWCNAIHGDISHCSLHPDENVPRLGFPETLLRHLNSVFVSPISVGTGLYGTRSQSLTLLELPPIAHCIYSRTSK